MKEIEHNAPGFQYKVYWKMEGPGERWNIRDIYDWKTGKIVIEDQPTYQEYRIKVVAHNDLGMISHKTLLIIFLSQARNQKFNKKLIFS